MFLRLSLPQRFAALAIISLLAACSDESPQPAPSPEPTTSEMPAAEWLDLRSHEDPAVWLVARQKYAEPRDRDVEKVRAVLIAAGRRFEETPRMIANRALQLQGMVNEVGDKISATALTRDLYDIMGGTAASPGFGNLGAFYVNLRKNGASRGAALETLAKQYNSAFGANR
jgi:hypothetical protein